VRSHFARPLGPGGKCGLVESRHAARIDHPGSAGHHQRADLCRKAQRVVQAGPAAHRLRDQPHLLQAELVDERRKVVGIGIGGRGSVYRSRRREAAVRECHAGVALREMRHLLPPGKMIAPEAVHEYERRAAALHVVVDAAIGSLEPAALFHVLSNAFLVQCSGLTAPFGARPLRISAACATVSMDWCSIAGSVRPAVCGVAMTSGRAASAGVGIWSGSRPTSRAQPAMRPASSARTSAASSTRLPREALTRYAVFFIIASCFSPIRFSVSAVATASGTT